ncbi:orotidine-5'-phosphate decarboxylase [Parenemella sanctibonifatiensis]|uniref:Orotidine-5'-phosphate decarboxylase n=1 Tax=Parenemella sanctibonifatiensis TaxID=2016505 RepID=A0A255EHQ7_9ACTN|nr:orotidine-5'-phosphate decarboxylase [Parenemella sanctibonifatiensis]OYN91056.1 orotidine-5'-phosphate decarboxylase [Parenemella sanctibonifatiensis]
MTAPENWQQRLAAATESRGRLCVGLDPHPGILQAWGLPDDLSGLAGFAGTVVSAFAGRVAVVKPQLAFFEAHGHRGLAILEQLTSAFRQAGTLVLLDAKRGDIGSTMAAYARTFLAPDGPYAADALTVSPYLGVRALAPAYELAAETGAGLYVLCRTSNPEAGWQLSGEPTLAQQVVTDCRAVNAELGSAVLGLVVGATRQLDVELPGTELSVLAPGFGAQGAQLGELDQLYGTVAPAVLPTASRSVLAAGPGVDALRAALADHLAQLPARADGQEREQA